MWWQQSPRLETVVKPWLGSCWLGDTTNHKSKPWYLVNPKIAGKWMFIPLKMVLIGIDPYPYILEKMFGIIMFGTNNIS